MTCAAAIPLLALVLAASAMRCEGGAAASSNYDVEHEVMDAGGGESSAGPYRQQASAGGLPGIATASGTSIAMEGFAAELWRAQALRIEVTTQQSEASVFQLGCGLELDDRSLLRVSPALFDWSTVSGPIEQISTSGQASAGHVYRDTLAIVRASLGPLSATRPLTIRDVFTDDFSLYAGDGIDDLWQVNYFGVDNPEGAADADPLGTGQDNLFKFTAGLDPKDPKARFSVSLVTTPPNRGMGLIVGPCFADRTYTLESSLDLLHWNPEEAAVKVGTDGTRAYYDSATDSGKKFYRVVITRK